MKMKKISTNQANEETRKVHIISDKEKRFLT